MTDPIERSSDDRVEVAVIGAGQAGLAMGCCLAKEGRKFTILEAADSIGAAWRTRWDSLVLFTPRRYDSLPGLQFPGDPDGYPGREEVIDYLESYASTFDLPLQLNSAVHSVASSGDGFILDLGGRTVQTDQVVVATGPFQVPSVPPFAADLESDVAQMHSTGYRRPSDVPQGTVVVVGGGNTGFQKPRNCRRPIRFTLRSDHGRHRCHSACLDATSSGG
jgi:putative flavoprotein involved in K+ transport